MRRRGRIRTILGLLLAILIGLPGDVSSSSPGSAGQPGDVHHSRTPGKCCKSAVLGGSAETQTAFIEEDGEADDDLDAKSLQSALLADLHDLPELRVFGDVRPSPGPPQSGGRACLRQSSRLRF